MDKEDRVDKSVLTEVYSDNSLPPNHYRHADTRWFAEGFDCKQQPKYQFLIT